MIFFYRLCNFLFQLPRIIELYRMKIPDSFMYPIYFRRTFIPLNYHRISRLFHTFSHNAIDMSFPYIYTSASLHKKLSTPLPCPCKTTKLLNIH